MSQNDKVIVIFVEGPDDERFFNKVIIPELKKKNLNGRCHQYAKKEKKGIKNFITSINSIKDWDYIFVADIDENPCITSKKEKIQEIYNNIDRDKIFVVRKEIEGWYLAGLDDKHCEKFKLKSINHTNSITKEKFKTLFSKKKFISELDLKVEILKYFSIDTAQQKNESFKYFMRKFLKLP